MARKPEIEEIEGLENEQNNDVLTNKKNELEKLRDEQAQGFMIRSRVQNIQLNEKPSKFFCNLEKAKYVDKTIKKIRLENGTLISSQKEILFPCEAILF